MSQDYLGEFEQMILLSIMRLGDHAYGLAVRDELSRVAGRTPSSGSLYTTLDRMEKKGWVTRERCTQDRRRVWCRITPSGLALLAELDDPIREVDEALGKVLDEPELVRFIDCLDRLRAHFTETS